MAATPAPRPGADVGRWRRPVTFSLLYDSKLLVPVDQLREWGCRFEDGTRPGPQLRLRCELAGGPTLMPTFNLNPPSNLNKRPKCSVPAPTVATLVSLIKPDLNGCFIFGKRHWDGITLVLDVDYEPPAHPVALPTLSEAGAVSALGRMQQVGHMHGKQPAPILVTDSEEDEPLIKRVGGAATKRRAAAQPGQPDHGPAAKQARVSTDGAGTSKEVAQTPPTNPATRGAAGVVANGGAAAAAAAAAATGAGPATAAAAAAGGSGAKQPPPATPPPAKPGAQLGAAFNSALQRRTSAAAEAAVQEQLAAQLPAIKARLAGEALAELKQLRQQVAAEVERQVAAELKRQVEELRSQLAGEMRRAMADEVRRLVADAMAEVQHDFFGVYRGQAALGPPQAQLLLCFLSFFRC